MDEDVANSAGVASLLYQFSFGELALEVLLSTQSIIIPCIVPSPLNISLGQLDTPVCNKRRFSSGAGRGHFTESVSGVR